MEAKTVVHSRHETASPPHAATCGHSVEFYADDGFLLDGLGRFIGSALDAGDAAVVIATPAHRDGLAARLRARGCDLDAAASSGRYVALDAAETLSRLMVDGWPDATRFAELVGGAVEQAAAAALPRRGVSAFGEMVALLWADDRPEAALRLEQHWNNLAATHTFNLHCAYPIDLFARAGDADALARVCSEHTRVTPAEGYASLTTEDERLREIVRLQQKARALETEVEVRRQVEAELRRSEAELRQAVQVRDEFLSVAAHELKTPVTSLRGFAQLLLRDARRHGQVQTERLTTALEVIDLQTGKLHQLLARLLDTARIEGGKLRVEPVYTDLAALVRSVVAHQVGCPRHTFVVEAPERLEALVDPVRFEQVIANLVENAVKFSPEGGPVTVRLELDRRGGPRLSVSDHGVGVPPEQHEAIFERFRQAHGDGHLSGLGLGLYVAREIVTLHGGSIWLEQPEHRGARFVVALPPHAAAG